MGDQSGPHHLLHPPPASAASRNAVRLSIDRSAISIISGRLELGVHKVRSPCNPPAPSGPWPYSGESATLSRHRLPLLSSESDGVHGRLPHRTQSDTRPGRRWWEHCHDPYETRWQSKNRVENLSNGPLAVKRRGRPRSHGLRPRSDTSDTSQTLVGSSTCLRFEPTHP